jgi:hypothetical protein
MMVGSGLGSHHQGEVMQAKPFDIGEAIFFFFKRFGEKPAAALWIAIWQIGLATAVIVGSMFMLWPAYMNLFELAALENTHGMSDVEEMELVFETLAPFFTSMILLVPAGIVLALMFQGAWMRFLTRGEVAAVIPFRFGGDEFRLLGVNILYIVVGTGVYMAAMVLFVVFGLGSAGIVAAGDSSVGAGLGAGLMMFVVFLAMFAAVLFIAVRLASAPALTVHDKKFRFFESWGASDGVFWHMLLVYLVVAVMVMILSMVLGTIIQIAMLGAMIPMIAELSALDDMRGDVSPEEVFAIFGDFLSQPGTMISVGLGLFLTYFMQIAFEGMWHGVGAYNACRYRGDGVGDAEDAPVLGADHPAGASPSEG